MMVAGCSFDLVEELTNVNEVTHRNFFHYKFCKWEKVLADTLVSLPHDEEKIRHITSLFERVGLPG